MALLIGIVVLSVSVILLIGGPQLTDSRETTEVSQAEQALTQFDADAARVATGGTSSQTTDLGLEGNSGTLQTEPERGRMKVVYVDNLENGSRTEVINTSLGTVRYENGETTVAYQGGGVWRSDGDGSVMVSPPEIVFEGKTLTMHVIESERNGAVHSDVQLSRSNASKQQYPNASADLENKVNGALIQITIQSRYYEAWGQLFEDEANTIVQYDHANERVVVLFVALPVDYAPEAGIVATSGPGEIRLEGNGPYIDSYNSSNGTYEETNGDEGSVKSAGEIIMKGGSEIDGDTEADKDIRIETNSAQIDGNASSGEQVYEHDNTSVTGTISQNTSGVPPVPPIDGLVDRKVDNLASDNDNNETTVIDDSNELNLTGTAELGPGRYYLDNMHVSDGTLVLNTTGGNITIGVETWVKLNKPAGGDPGNIEIKGDGEVRLFVKSEEKTEIQIPSAGTEHVHFAAKGNSSVRTVDTPRERSTQFLIFGPSEFEGAMAGSNSNSPSVTTVIIAPAGPRGEGSFLLKHGELYGAIMTGNLTLNNKAEIHFDRTIIGTRIPLAPTVPRLEYLYITEHEIEVESS
jgi:cytoskeletal protein CcmA (bactofilin family)